MTVAVLGVDDTDFVFELQAGGALVTAYGVDSRTDALFYAADSGGELRRLAQLRERIDAAGAIWVISRKGKTATLKDVEVMAAAKAAGLVDTKVVSFSESHTALKLVIPVDQRRKVARTR